jgi:hypothetical protein
LTFFAVLLESLRDFTVDTIPWPSSPSGPPIVNISDPVNNCHFGYSFPMYERTIPNTLGVIRHPQEFIGFYAASCIGPSNLLRRISTPEMDDWRGIDLLDPSFPDQIAMLKTLNDGLKVFAERSFKICVSRRTIYQQTPVIGIVVPPSDGSLQTEATRLGRIIEEMGLAERQVMHDGIWVDEEFGTIRTKP